MDRIGRLVRPRNLVDHDDSNWSSLVECNRTS